MGVAEGIGRRYDQNTLYPCMKFSKKKILNNFFNTWTFLLNHCKELNYVNNR